MVEDTRELSCEAFQFSSVAQLCLTLCDPMGCSMSCLPVHHQLLEFTQTHVHGVGDAIQTISSSVVPFSSHLQSFPASGSFQMSQFFASGGQNMKSIAFIRALIPFMMALPPWPNYFPKAPPPNGITLGTGFQHMNFGGTQTFRT